MIEPRILKQKLIARFSKNKLIKSFFDYVHFRKRKKARQQLQEDGLKISQDICNELTNKNMNVFAISGSLLGLIREGRYIAHDDDLDFAIVIDENFNWTDLQTSMEGLGYVLIREFGFDDEITEQTYLTGDLTIDFFILKPSDDGYRSYFYTYVYNDGRTDLRAKYLDWPDPFPIHKELYDGYAICIPSNEKDYLVTQYGPDWEIPDPTFNTGSRWHFSESTTCFVHHK